MDGTLGLFSPAGAYLIGGHPISIATADFNNDGNPDIAVADNTGNQVSVLLSNGDGTFQAARNFSVGQSPQSIAVGDFNRSGSAGFATVSTTLNNVTVMLSQPADDTPPVTMATQSPPANARGWNNTGVAVTLSSTDSETNGTGVREIDYAIGANPQVIVPGASAAVNFTAQSIYSLSYYGVDNAGNVESAQTFPVQIDETPPTITASQSPSANSAGWNNTNVTVTFSCADDLSGVASCPSPTVVSAEGAAQKITGTATDLAGNAASATATVSLDKTPPLLTMPSLASSYLLNSKLTFSFSATDALSGVATSQAAFNGQLITSGTTVTLTHLGTNSFVFTATDVAGNTATQTATFPVDYNFIGFLAPIPNDGSGVFKLGSTVPVKFQLTDANGAIVSNAVATLTVQMVSAGAPVGAAVYATASGSSDTGNLFRFDITSDDYVYNLSTGPFVTGTWQIQAHLDDGTVHTVFIGLK